MKGISQVHQLGFVVTDMQKAMDSFGKTYGIAQWYRAVNEPKGELFYRGKPFEDPGYDVVVGYCGSTEIELITSSAEENIYTLFLKERGPGLHHTSWFVANIDPWVERYEKLGFRVEQNGTINGRTMKTRFAYLMRPEEGFGNIVEFSEVKARKIPLRRSGWNIGIGALTGDLIKL